MPNKSEFQKELETLINRKNIEKESDTPDFILAEYLTNCLRNYEHCVKSRDVFFNVNMWTEDKKAKPIT